jgi:hypothetical protein
LFATTDLAQWLACDKATVFVKGNPTMSTVKASSKSSMPCVAVRIRAVYLSLACV